jgi:hypothetical protein
VRVIERVTAGPSDEDSEDDSDSGGRCDVLALVETVSEATWLSDCEALRVPVEVVAWVLVRVAVRVGAWLGVVVCDSPTNVVGVAVGLPDWEYENGVGAWEGEPDALTELEGELVRETDWLRVAEVLAVPVALVVRVPLSEDV